MDLQSGFERPDAYRGGYVSIGNFDGVHRGHQAMVARLVTRARQAAAPAAILTFDPPPAAILAPGQIPPRLMTVARKAELLGDCGVDCVIVYPTDRNLLQLTASEFFALIVRGEIEARGLVEGPNFRFGRRREGDIETLDRLCADAGLSLDVIAPAVDASGRLISSTEIREEIQAGRLLEAGVLLGRPFEISGCVVQGAQRGRTLGFPTANLADIRTLLPPFGVYAGTCRVAGSAYRAAVHVGPNATFGETTSTVEVHLLDFEGDLYGCKLTVAIWERIRGTQRFDGPAALAKQLRTDIDEVRHRIPPGASN